MVKKLSNVKGLGQVVEADSNFYTNLQELEQAGASLISPRDEAYARLNSNIGKTYGTFTTAGLEYVKGEKPILRLDSRLLNPELAKQAAEANRNGIYFSTKNTKEYEESLKQAEQDKNKDPKERNVIILPSREVFDISLTENSEVLECLLKDQAKAYSEIKKVLTFYPVSKETIDEQNGTLLTQLWFYSVAYRSGLVGDNRDLGYGYGARGVQKSGEATQKSPQEVEVYTPNQISKVLNDLKLIGLEKQIFKALRK